VCGSGVHNVIDFDRHLILMTSETQADSYDEDTLDEDTDVVACPGAINLRDWLEDEILLACPMFPKHDACAELAGRAGEKRGPTCKILTTIRMTLLMVKHRKYSVPLLTWAICSRVARSNTFIHGALKWPFNRTKNHPQSVACTAHTRT